MYGYSPDFVSATQTINMRAVVTPQRCWKLVGAALPRAMSRFICLKKKINGKIKIVIII